MNKKVIILSALIFVIFAISAGAIFYMKSVKKGGSVAYIYQNDRLIKTINLKNVTEPYTITIEGDNGGRNVIEVRKGSIGIIEADCPDKLCKKMGFISDGLMPVTCLPNHLVIRVDCEEENELDGVVY